MHCLNNPHFIPSHPLPLLVLLPRTAHALMRHEQARDLLVMDKNMFSKGGSSDPYATLKLGGGDEFAPKVG